MSYPGHAHLCTHCGEQYFDAPVYKRLEETARRRERIKAISGKDVTVIE